jgi:hypothetical protein
VGCMCQTLPSACLPWISPLQPEKPLLPCPQGSLGRGFTAARQWEKGFLALMYPTSLPQSA